MSIFGSRKSETPPVKPAAPAPAPRPSTPHRSSAPSSSAGDTLIAKGSKVVGEITGNAELVINGEVDGEITLESKVIVSQGGLVKGPIRAISVQVAGKVIGDVEGQERVEVLQSGGLEGNILAPKIHIADGALCNGSLKMSAPPKLGGGKKTPNAGNAASKSTPKSGPSGEDKGAKPTGSKASPAAGSGKNQ